MGELTRHFDTTATDVLRRALRVLAEREELTPPNFPTMELAELEQHGARVEWLSDVPAALEGKTWVLPWALRVEIQGVEIDCMVPPAWYANEADRHSMEPIIVREVLEAAYRVPELRTWVRALALEGES